MKKRTEKTIRTLLWIYIISFIVALLHFGRRIFLSDTFLIPSESMSPTLSAGDRIRVNKLIFGPRIYTSLDFSEGNPLRCIRLPGIRAIRPGDVITFNFPFGGEDWSHIEFRINHVYCKRVLGCPGDRIGIVDGHCWNDRILHTIGSQERQEELNLTDDSLLAATGRYRTVPLSLPVWNCKNMGPLTVPARGMTLPLTPFNAELYRRVIEYENGNEISFSDNGTVLIGGQPADSITFRSNWYFALGDNATDSQDSRYWGFIPEDFIIGVVPGI